MQENNRIGEWTRSWALNHKLICEYTVEATSTNDLAKNYLYKSHETVLFVTESQSKGRGRGANIWINSKPGSALLASWSFHLTQAPQPITTPLLGLAVYRSLMSALGVQKLSLKAPNDIYVDGKKAGGLLVEIISQGDSHRLIVGFGLNVFSKPEIANACEILPFVSESLTLQSWDVFLSILYDELQRAIHLCTQSQLSETSRDELLIALNHNPNLPEKYTVVEPNGTLQTKKSTIPWHSL